MAIEQIDIVRTEVKVAGVEQYKGDLARGADSLDAFAGSEQRAGEQAGSLSAGLKALTAIGATAFFAKLASDSARAAMGIEITEKQFGRLLGSSRAAGQQVEWLHRMARDIHGQSFEGIAGATRMMVDFGLATEQDTKTLNLFADAALARGQDIQSMVVFAERMKEGMYMARAGIPYGVTPTALKEQGIRFEGRQVIPEDQEKLYGATMAIWQQKYAGLNKEVAKTASDAAEDMGQAYEELKVKLGEGLLPVISTGARALERFSDVLRSTDPAFLRLISTMTAGGVVLGSFVALQQGYLTLKRIGAIAENTDAIAKGRNTAATTALTGATERQTLAQWAKDKASLQAMGVSDAMIAQTEAEIMARNANTAAIEREALAMRGLGGAGVGAAAGAGLGGVAATGGVLSKIGPMVGKVGQIGLLIAALAEATNIYTAITEKATEAKYFERPKTDPLGFSTDPSFGERFKKNFFHNALPSENIRSLKGAAGIIEQGKFWEAIGGVKNPDVVPPLIAAQTRAKKAEDAFQHGLIINAPEAELAKYRQSALRDRELEIKYLDTAISKAKQKGIAEAGINALLKERSDTEEKLASLKSYQAEVDFTKLLAPATAAERTAAGLESQIKRMETMKAPAEQMIGKRREELKTLEDQKKVYQNLIDNAKKLGLTEEQKNTIMDAQLATLERYAAIYVAIKSVPIELSKRAAEKFGRGEAERDAANYIAAAAQRPWSPIAAFEADTMANKQAELAADKARIAYIENEINKPENKNNLFFQDQAKVLLDERLDLTKQIADLEKEIAMIPEQRFARRMGGIESYITYLQARLQRAGIENAPMGERALWQKEIARSESALIPAYQRQMADAQSSGDMAAEMAARGKIAGARGAITEAGRYPDAVAEERLKSQIAVTETSRELAKSFNASSTSLLAFDRAVIAADKSLAAIYYKKYQEANTKAPGSPEAMQYLAQTMSFIGNAQKTWEQTDLFTQAGQKAGLKMADIFNQRLMDGAQTYAARLTSELHQVALNLPSGISNLMPSPTQLNRMLPAQSHHRPALYGMGGLWEGAEKDMPGLYPYPAKPKDSNTVLQINITGDSKADIMSAVSKFIDEQFAFESSAYSGVQ